MGKFINTTPSRADAIIVLGAAVWETGPSPTLRRRANLAAELYLAGAARRIIATGGLGRYPPTEAAAIATLLIKAKVPAAAIYQEDQSTTTLENLLFARSMLSKDQRRILIVTDFTHAPRAKLTAKHLGFYATSASPSLRSGHPRTFLRQMIRELFAYPTYALRLWLGMRKRKD